MTQRRRRATGASSALQKKSSTAFVLYGCQRGMLRCDDAEKASNNERVERLAEDEQHCTGSEQNSTAECCDAMTRRRHLVTGAICALQKKSRTALVLYRFQSGMLRCDDIEVKASSNGRVKRLTDEEPHCAGAIQMPARCAAMR
jgi:hypothetical protein